MIILLDREKEVKLTRIRVSKLLASELEEIGNFLNLTKYTFKRYKRSLQLIAVSVVKYGETALAEVLGQSRQRAWRSRSDASRGQGCRGLAQSMGIRTQQDTDVIEVRNWVQRENSHLTPTHGQVDYRLK